jgi:hypothetical protein
MDPLRASNNDGVAAPVAIAFRRKRAWLQLVARIQAQQPRVINPRSAIARHLEKW